MNETTQSDRTRGRGLLLPLAFVLGPAVVLLLVLAVAGLRSEHLVVEVPLGTAAKIAAGETVELLPSRLEFAVGDTLEIRNHDLEAHDVGPYNVAAGQSLTQTFASPGVLQGICTLHPEGEVTIVVR